MVAEAKCIKLTSIWIFPIKSARGFQVQQSNYGETGLDYDRQWMIVEEQTHRFLTARTISRMVLIAPTIDLASQTLTISIPSYGEYPASTHTIPLNAPRSITDDQDRYHCDLQIWSSPPLDGYDVGTAELTQALSKFMGKPVLLIQKGVERREAGPGEGWIESLRSTGIRPEYSPLPAAVSWADQFPILLVNKASLQEVDSKIKNDDKIKSIPRLDLKRWGELNRDEMEIERFRGNLVVEGEIEPWEEDGWGELLFKNDSEDRQETLYIAARCARCLLPNVDPASGVRDKVVPDLVLRPWREGVWNRYPTKTCFGVNAVPKSSRGTLKVGDLITVVRRFDQKQDGNYDRPEDAFSEP